MQWGFAYCYKNRLYEPTLTSEYGSKQQEGIGMRTYKAGIKDSQGFVFWVEVRAQTAMDTKNMLEAQYGRSAIAHLPVSID